MPAAKKSSSKTGKKRKRPARAKERRSPKRDYPSIRGRAEWFQQRAGCLPESLSLERLRLAMRHGETLSSGESRAGAAVEAGLTLLGRAGAKPPAKPMLIDETCRVQEGLRHRRVKGKQGLGAASGVVNVPKFAGDSATLFVPLKKNVGQVLDLETVTLVSMDDPRNTVLLESSGLWHEHTTLVAEIRHPGAYQVWGLPRDPWLRVAFETLCLHWNWIRYEPRLYRQLGAAAVREVPNIVDRICQLILCAADYAMLDDPRALEEIGIGLPPDEFGMPGAGTNICDQCLGNFLGDPILDGGLVVRPPAIKICGRRRPRCSKWQSIGPYPTSDFFGIGRLTQIDIHPTDGDTLIAASAGGGVWRTDNRGLSWRPLMEHQPTLTIGAVAFAPSNPSVIYAASGEDAGPFNPAWPGIGVYRSDDDGKTWDITSPVPSSRFSALVVDPDDPNVVYAAGNTGLHKSIDGGATWIANPGLGSLFDGRVTDVVIAHDEPDRIYIGVQQDGVYLSTTGGEVVGGSAAFQRLDGVNQLPSGGTTGWPKLTIGRGGANGSDFLAVKMGPSGSQIFSTTDAGTSWTELAAAVASVSFDEWSSLIAVDPEDEDVLYAGGSTTLKRTTNGGAAAGDWTSIYPGVHPDQQDLSFDPADSTKIFLANDGGLYGSTNRGDDWEFVSSGLRITQFYDFDISEKDRDIVGGGAQDNGVYYRTASGAWRMPNFFWDGTQFDIDPTDPEICYFSSQSAGRIAKSTDGCQTIATIPGAGDLTQGSPWVTVIALDPTDPIADPADKRILFVCGTTQLFRSSDGAQNFQRVNDGGGAAFATAGTISALEYAPGDGSVLYLGTQSGSLYRGKNGGATAGDWTRVDTPGDAADALFPNVQIQGIAIDANDADHVWVAFTGNGVSFSARPNQVANPLGVSHLFKTTDGGATWEDASGLYLGLSLPDVPTSAVALDDQDRNIAYVGTDIGVYRTTDGGASWSQFNVGLARSPVMELRFGRRHRRVYAATMGRGIYVRDV